MILQIYSKFMDVIAKIEKVFLAVTGVLLVAVVLYQVILRYCFTAANAWSEELARYIFIYDALIASALAIQKNTHLQVDFLINTLKPKARCISNIISTLIGMVFLVFLFSYSLTLCTASSANMSAGLGVSMMVPYTCIPIGSILMLLASIEVVLKNIDQLKKLKAEGGTRE
ncbi:TRAP transporter small permease [uncultured Dysosmobacter sp.]|uniref:TRAP transporter small permease n=1 Tax=uncultured Dysosmobacter sp. TaxID=2591384 RepID=UPI0026274618|nr:TRAP transporter small permease [uncultured Dysosmobacter sp.]